MKILHTSDWHLGKKTEGKDRAAEQRQALAEIKEIADKNGVHIVLVCGDIFDTYTPSAEAEDMFYEAVTALSDGGKRFVAVIAGNHDDPLRLCAASVLAQKNAILISGGGEEKFHFPPHCAVKLLESGKGYVKVQTGGEIAVINYLSYPSESRLKEYASDTPYSEKVKNWLSDGNRCFENNTVNITMSHLFCAGAQPTGEEREIEAGGVKACSPSVFSDKCHYVALGHIHRQQKIKDNIYYSGALLQYSADEKSQKSVIIADIGCDGVKSVNIHNLASGRKIVNFTAHSFNEAYEFLKSCNDWTYIKICQNQPLLYSESKELNSFDSLLGIELEINSSAGKTETASRRHLSESELFSAYYKQKFAAEPPQELINLYIEILNS